MPKIALLPVRRSRWLTSMVVLLTATFFVPAVFASTPTPGRQPWDSEEGPRPTEVTKSVEVEIKEVRPDGAFLVAFEGDELEVRLDDKVQVRAESKKEFDGRRKLVRTDIEAGQKVRLTYLADSGKIVRARILKTRTTAAG